MAVKKARKKAAKHATSTPLPVTSTVKNQPLTFFLSLRQLKSDKRLLLLLALIALPVGIASQLSWLKFRCIGEPFLGSVKATCKDNLWRMIFGGPLVFLMSYITAAWMNATARPLQRWQILLPFACLLPTIFLPFIHAEPAHDRTVQGIILLFLFALIIVARYKLISMIAHLFAKPNFRTEVTITGDDVTLRLLGKLTLGEKEWILDSVQREMQGYATRKRHIIVDLESLTNFSTEFLWLIHFIHAFTLFSDSNLTFSGPDIALKIIRKNLGDAKIRFVIDKKARHGGE